jgi:Fur family zinc uptake transcriptional regulator
MAALTPEALESQLDAASRSCMQQSTQLTELRRTVLGLVLQAERPLTAYQLLDRLKEKRRGAVPPTVYRALDFLLENKLIHKIERLNAFVPCTEAGHHAHSAQFLICRACGTVIELEDTKASHALEQAAQSAGFRPSSMIVEIEGVCQACSGRERKEEVLF